MNTELTAGSGEIVIYACPYIEPNALRTGYVALEETKNAVSHGDPENVLLYLDTDPHGSRVEFARLLEEITAWGISAVVVPDVTDLGVDAHDREDLLAALAASNVPVFTPMKHLHGVSSFSGLPALVRVTSSDLQADASRAAFRAAVYIGYHLGDELNAECEIYSALDYAENSRLEVARLYQDRLPQLAVDADSDSVRPHLVDLMDDAADGCFEIVLIDRPESLSVCPYMAGRRREAIEATGVRVIFAVDVEPDVLAAELNAIATAVGLGPHAN